jgi:hypothetical protein
MRGERKEGRGERKESARSLPSSLFPLRTAPRTRARLRPGRLRFAGRRRRASAILRNRRRRPPFRSRARRVCVRER